MPKVRLLSMLEEGGDFEDLLRLAKSKLADSMMAGKGRGTWISEDGQEIMAKALFVPEVVPKHYNAVVTRNAANPSYVFAYVRELSKTIPVAIPRKLRRMLVKKNVIIEAIESRDGTSYRYLKQGVA